MIRLIEITEKGDWGDGSSSFSDFPLTQSFVYGEIQKASGKKIRRFAILHDDIRVGFVQFIEYSLFGTSVYWYAPYGPVMNDFTARDVADIKTCIAHYTKKDNVVFVRLDFSPALNPRSQAIVKSVFTRAPHFSYTGAYFQPRDEWYTDIAGDENAILSAMHQKTRYSVRLAEKRGVNVDIVKKNLTHYLKDFLLLMQVTSKRNNFSLHDEHYYKSYLEEMEESGEGFLVVASLSGEILAIHLIVVVGSVAHYVFGSSSNTKRDLCGPYLAHYKAMLESKAMGARFYNFGAVSRKGGEDPKWATLTAFKQKFGGKRIEHSPFYDMVIKPVWYYIYMVRKIIKFYI